MEQEIKINDRIKEIVCVQGNKEILRHYIVKEYLGKGGFAKCYKVVQEDNNQVLAIKVVNKQSLTKLKSRQKIISEIKIHKTLQHINIVQFKHVFEDRQFVYILMELCINQTLNDMLKKRKNITEFEMKVWMKQIINGVKYLHNNLVIHRDLKLGNLFIDENMQIKIGDLGLAAKLNSPDEKKKTICGTPNYIAPEIINGNKEGHSFPVDIWSIGVIMYTLVGGKPPFETNEVSHTYKKIKENKFSYPEKIKFSDSLKNLIDNILVLDELDRFNLNQIMSHPFFNQCALPKSLPQSVLNQNLSIEYINQYLAIKPNLQNIQKEQEEYQQVQWYKYGCVNRQYQIQNIDQSVISKVYVKQWVDYSTKYGLGYILSNGQNGVFFNDSTKVVSIDENRFHYIQKDQDKKNEQIHEYTMNNYPDVIKKKVTLMQHFKSYLFEHSQHKIEQQKLEQSVYVKKWMKTNHAIMFRLSNKIVQVNFADKTEIILNSDAKTIQYVDKQGDIKHYHISNAMESGNNEMIKRLQYTKDILTFMLNRQKNKGSEINDVKLKL